MDNACSQNYRQTLSWQPLAPLRKLERATILRDEPVGFRGENRLALFQRIVISATC